MRNAIEHYNTLKIKGEKLLYYKVCVEMMDDNLRENLHGYFENDRDFLTAYCIYHLEEFAQEFIVN